VTAVAGEPFDAVAGHGNPVMDLEPAERDDLVSAVVRRGAQRAPADGEFGWEHATLVAVDGVTLLFVTHDTGGQNGP
jgi:hypothetical protein